MGALLLQSFFEGIFVGKFDFQGRIVGTTQSFRDGAFEGRILFEYGAAVG